MDIPYTLLVSLFDGRAWVEVAPDDLAQTTPEAVCALVAADLTAQANAIRSRGNSPAARRRTRLLEQADFFVGYSSVEVKPNGGRYLMIRPIHG